eukprot:TRINITY_DN21099_c0_g3_i3.p3 TRINITY_DN21099_c0_g3~~TRINITY_DN21099_c0_g3_i3.p3  ORF type:complete len:190 (+),score=-23.66 TRINITY_DN21099_c0_g3_i3:316-885(+)
MLFHLITNGCVVQHVIQCDKSILYKQTIQLKHGSMLSVQYLQLDQGDRACSYYYVRQNWYILRHQFFLIFLLLIFLLYFQMWYGYEIVGWLRLVGMYDYLDYYVYLKKKESWNNTCVCVGLESSLALQKYNQRDWYDLICMRFHFSIFHSKKCSNFICIFIQQIKCEPMIHFFCQYIKQTWYNHLNQKS